MSTIFLNFNKYFSEKKLLAVFPKKIGLIFLFFYTRRYGNPFKKNVMFFLKGLHHYVVLKNINRLSRHNREPLPLLFHVLLTFLTHANSRAYKIKYILVNIRVIIMLYKNNIYWLIVIFLIVQGMKLYYYHTGWHIRFDI